MKALIATAACALAAVLVPRAAAAAEEPLKIGLIAEFSGPFAGYGRQIHDGMKAWMKLHGDTVAGRKVEITSHHYSAAHDSAENAAFRKAYAEANGPELRPNFMAVAGYDGMAAIYEVAKKLGGRIDADRAMEVLKGLRLDSPRGHIRIDPETRDIVQTVYIRRTQRVAIRGGLFNIEFERFPDVKDPGK